MPVRRKIITKNINLANNEIVISPFYRDLHKLKKWNFIKDKLLVYEKIDGLEKEEKVNNLHYKIPAYGEGTMALIYHIVKNYHNLEERIHYTKAHWVSGGGDKSKPEIFLKDIKKEGDFYHHTTGRTFILIHEDLRHLGGEGAVKFLLEKNGKWKNQSIKFYHRNLNCPVCTNENKCSACGHIMINDHEFNDTFFEFSGLFKGCLSYDKMKEIFPDWEPKTELKKIYKEGSFTVSKSLILKHDISVYKEILYNNCKKSLMCRDSMALFILLFFEETKKLI